MKWTVRATDSANIRWEILFRTNPVGEILWVNDLDLPMVARDVIERAMNGAIAADQPARCWTFGTEGSPNRWTLLHNGHLMAELCWEHRPPVTTDIWQARVLAGLNFTDNGRITPPAPAHLHARSA